MQIYADSEILKRIETDRILPDGAHRDRDSMCFDYAPERGPVARVVVTRALHRWRPRIAVSVDGVELHDHDIILTPENIDKVNEQWERIVGAIINGQGESQRLARIRGCRALGIDID